MVVGTEVALAEPATGDAVDRGRNGREGLGAKLHAPHVFFPKLPTNRIGVLCDRISGVQQGWQVLRAVKNQGHPLGRSVEAFGTGQPLPDAVILTLGSLDRLALFQASC